MHKLQRYIKAIDKTHRGLGRLVATCLLCMKARKFLLIVSVAGSGKSTAMRKALEANLNGKFVIQEFTRSGLQLREKELTDFKGCLMLEDLGNIDTAYSLKESVKCAVSLCYEHELSKLNASTNLNIRDFYGSVVTSIQPVKMHQIIKGDDWEAVMRDKTIRYYHLVRPSKPNSDYIKVKLDWGRNFDDVKLGKKLKRQYAILEEMGLNQWGRSRVNEHIKDFLRGAAALDGRLKVNIKDYKVVYQLLRPMTLEHHLLEKEGFETEKTFLGNHMCMLTELASYKPLTQKDIATDFGVAIRTVQGLLQKVPQLWQPDINNRTKLYPTAEAVDILKEGGFMNGKA